MPLSRSLGSPIDRPASLTLRRSRAGSHWLDYLMRSGQVARGLVFLIPGVLALRLAAGTHGAAIDQTRAIEMIGHQPFGRASLLVVAVGLAGYVLWGLYRAFLDPLGRGRSVPGLFMRLGYLTSALAYTGLLVFAVGLVVSSPSHAFAAHDSTAGLLARPFGRWLVGIVGLCWMVAGGVVQLLSAWRGTFEHDLDLERMSRGERWWAARLGRIGLAARGLVFLMIGVALVGTALHVGPEQSHDMAGALLGLLRQPFGRPLLVVVAAGLVTFGVYSILCARWARLRVARAPMRRTESVPSRSY